MKIQQSLPPAGSLIEPMMRVEGGHVDCYNVEVAGTVDLPTFIEVFLDTWVFRLERRILALAGQQFATKQDISDLAHGRTVRFATWKVRDRSTEDLLMDVQGQPISTWLCVKNTPEGGGKTILYFGSAVAPAADAKGRPKLGLAFRMLMPFHKLYSRILLTSAAKELDRQVGRHAKA